MPNYLVNGASAPQPVCDEEACWGQAIFFFLAFSPIIWSRTERTSFAWPGSSGWDLRRCSTSKSRLALVELVDQAGKPPLADFLRGDHRLVHERQLAAVAGDQPFGFEPVEERGDGRVRPLASGGTRVSIASRTVA